MGIVIYTRISEDRDGESVAVERQEKECREYADSLGLTLDARHYSDNDISATKGKRRPGFEALLAFKPSGIVVWHQDRLIRVSADLERVLNLGIPVYSVTGGMLDLATPQGRAVARTVTAWSTYEGEQKAQRQMAKNRQNVQKGLPVPGKRRFGYLPGNIKAHPEEAPIVLAAYKAIRAGESIVKVSKWTGLNRITLRRVLASPCYVGQVQNRGQWYPAAPEVDRLVPEDLWQEVQAILEDPSRKPTVGNQPAHVASGLARCECGAKLRAKNGNYICSVSFAHTSIKQHMMNEALKWEVFSHLAGDAPTAGLGLLEAEQELAELEEERSELSALLVVKGVQKAPLVARLGEIDTEATEVTERIHALRAEHVAAGVVAEIRKALLAQTTDQEGADWWEAKWDSLDLGVKRELVRGLDVVLFSGRGPERIKVSAKV